MIRASLSLLPLQRSKFFQGRGKLRGLIEYRDYAILCAVLKLIEIFLSKADPSLQNNIKMLKLFLTWNYSVKKQTNKQNSNAV